MSKTFIALGIDPSLTHTGWAVVEIDLTKRKIIGVLDAGTIVTVPSKEKKVRKSSDTLHRARTIATKLNEVIAQHGIKFATSEIPSGAQSASAATAFGIVTGIVASLPIPVIEVTPREVKLATAGKATADKEDMVCWAVGKTVDVGGSGVWATSTRQNDWGILVGDRYVLKSEEHKADAICGVQAAISSEQFRQLAGLALSLA